MTSLIFDPTDLDYTHISNVIVRTVQASLTPKIQSGRGDVMLVPKFLQKVYRDAMPVSPNGPWADRILILCLRSG